MPQGTVTRLEARPPAGPLLDVRDLTMHLLTPRGRVKAVDGVTFTLERGRTLGVVGESGSGKTVPSRSIMDLLPRTDVVRGGSVRFEGPYAQENCHVDRPPLTPAAAPGHSFACWYPVGAPEGAAALERNLRERLPQTAAAMEGAGLGTTDAG